MRGRMFIVHQEQGPSLAASYLGPARGAGVSPLASAPPFFITRWIVTIIE